MAAGRKRAAVVTPAAMPTRGQAAVRALQLAVQEAEHAQMLARALPLALELQSGGGGRERTTNLAVRARMARQTAQKPAATTVTATMTAASCTSFPAALTLQCGTSASATPSGAPAASWSGCA